MIFANKQDLAGAKESGEIAALLGLASIKDRSWQIQGGPSRIRKGNLFQSYNRFLESSFKFKASNLEFRS